LVTVTEFTFDLNKEEIFQSIQCYKNNAGYEETSAVYDTMVKVAKSLVKPCATYFFAEKKKSFNFKETQHCRQMVYCLITLGSAISEYAKQLFNQEDYLESVLLDAIADNLLFRCADQLYEFIKKEAQEAGLGITRRLSPGEGHEMDMSLQKDILALFPEENTLGITVTPGYMLNPLKSHAFIYGADSKQAMSKVDHDCAHCDNMKCMRRKTSYAGRDVTVTIYDQYQRRHVVAAKSFESLLNIMSREGIVLNAPCNGRGSCGKCKVTVQQGYVWFNTHNFEKLTREELQKGVCLACSSFPMEDCSLQIDTGQSEIFAIATEFSPSLEKPDSGFTPLPFQLAVSDLKSGASITTIINTKFGKEYEYTVQALQKLGNWFNGSASKEQTLLLLDDQERIVNVYDGAVERVFGIAIDIGTTTLVFSLVDLFTREVVNTYSMLNSQRQFGADVISRIQYTAEGGLPNLQRCVQTDIIEGVTELTGTIASQMWHVVITGNTTMLHLLLGLHCESLGVYPFTTVTTQVVNCRFSEVFPGGPWDCKMTILPGISAYVGADIAAGMLFTQFDKLEKTVLLIDIGTNGEMVIGNKERALCLATAAGPAFEGANISCGTGSVAGAISEVSIQNSKFVYQTIQQCQPVGICGSAVIDIVAACLREGWIDETGHFSEELAAEGQVEVARDRENRAIVFTQKDIREVQLAKSAIRSGIELLVKEYQAGYHEIDQVYIAGGFGSHIHIGNAAAIGLLPKELVDKVQVVGNSSLGGAVAYLLQKNSRQTIDLLVKNTMSMDLSANAEFNDLFIENLLLG
jgi:uncharacterized 2Fe-2S/4Fe-4S cluster protein (DUF4445 family)